MFTLCVSRLLLAACLTHLVCAQIGILFIDVAGSQTAFKAQLINAIMGSDLADDTPINVPKIITYHRTTNGQDFVIYDAHNVNLEIAKTMFSIYVKQAHIIVVCGIADTEGTLIVNVAFNRQAVAVHNVKTDDIKTEMMKFWELYDRTMFGDFTERLKLCSLDVVWKLAAGIRPKYPEVTMQHMRDAYYQCIDEDILIGWAMMKWGIVAAVVLLSVWYMFLSEENPSAIIALLAIVVAVIVISGVSIVGMMTGAKDTGAKVTGDFTMSSCARRVDVYHQHQDYMIISGVKVVGEWANNKPHGVQDVGGLEIVMRNGIVTHNGVPLECVWR